MRTTRTCSSCGYTADYASIPLADAHHRRHSCDKHRLAVERDARRADRARTRAPRACIHPRSQHVHGTRSAYVKDRCRCSDCTAANTAVSRTANRQRAYGRWQPLVDAGPAQEHLVALRAAGMGVQRIASLADMSVSHVRELAAPDSAHRRTRPSTAVRILNISVDDPRAPRSCVDATGTRRRLQALVAIGWSLELLATELVRRPSSLRRSLTSLSVTARTAQDVATLYERLSNTPPPRDNGVQRATADAARAHAVAHGWLPPLVWDDIDNDVPPPPAATELLKDDVDEIAVERAMAGDGIQYADLTAAEQAQVVHRLTDRGQSLRDIAGQLATTKRTVSRQRAAAGPR
ncbi:helix-turn-helix domain containing protein [Modestobacter muralis]|uniref:Helix-turn-helix domain containing protein n=1 Tax=Modestobacter muralis TaxID=1608614 RepID=A0A6P0H941_9ACTN|nr:helix-turn-helix domain containing protein [Modestobacter muralis]NEK95252.1 helix-turn-helix domain containing protein [Modestobacter muralis]NEN52140.1 helix-turn-helix domain containing protein [Modestobacter muralis]